MTTFAEIFRSGSLALGEAARTRWSGEEINSTRYVLSIYTGLSSAFPDEVRKAGGRRVVFAAVNNFTPYCIALNEYADLGVSAFKEFANGADPHLNSSRLEIHRVLREELAKWQNKTAETNSDIGDVRRVMYQITKDFVLLSERRDDFSGNSMAMERHLNLDSAIIETGYLATALPKVVEIAGIDLEETLNEGVSAREYLERKYGLFLKIFDGDFEPDQLEPTQRALLAMHAYEMGMKAIDDGQGENVDRYTGVISFVDVMRGNDVVDVHAGLKKRSSQYFNTAKDLGMSSLVMRGGSIARSLSRVIKTRWSKEVLPCEPHEVGQLVRQRGVATANLRHDLESVGLIGEIYRKKL